MEQPKTKVCSKCGRELPITEFATNKKCKDGHIGRCKDCSNQYYRQWYARKIGKQIPAANNPTAPNLNPKYIGITPRELQQEMRELKAELIARGFNVEVKCTILQEINI